MLWTLFGGNVDSQKIEKKFILKPEPAQNNNAMRFFI